MELSVSTDKPTYEFGDHATIAVSMSFDEPGAGNGSYGAIVKVQQNVDGSWVQDEEYPEFALWRSEDDLAEVGWTCHPVRRGRWGRFRVVAMVFEYERHEIGSSDCEFTVAGPA